ncbi:MAG: CotH kinase family protein [Treponema sp.]|nr:CotH kinase family protein [Treponema sp.]
MKKSILVLFTFFLSVSGLFSAGQKNNSADDSKVIFSDTFSVYNWEKNYLVPSESFFELKPGSKIEFIFQPAVNTTYTRVFLLDSNWNNYLFSNVVCTPDSTYVKQEQTDEKTNEKKWVTKISVPDYDYENDACYTVTITLNEREIMHLKQNGLLFCGNNFTLRRIELLYENKKSSKNKNSVIQNYSEIYDVPIISITTKNGNSLTKENYEKSKIVVTNCDKKYKLSVSGQAKVRGNSTADDKWAPKQKPLRLKFDKRQNVLGLHGGKKYNSWVLLRAEHFGPSDYVGFKLAHEIYKTSKYNYYASDCAFVHVFINDEYQGQYLLCEQNQIESDRIDIDTNPFRSKSNKIGYMIELDNYSWDDLKDNAGRWFGNDGLCQQGREEYHFTLKYLSDKPSENIKFMVWGYEQTGLKLKDINGEARGCPADDYSLKSSIYSDSQVEFIQKYMTNLWAICYRAIERNEFYKFDSKYNLVKAPEYKTAKQTIDAVIDLESLCNEMILEELVRDNDVGAGSLYMAIDFTKKPGEKYHKFTFECPWDFNWGYSPIENDNDGGKYWKNKKQYFAGGWQSLNILDDAERSYPWFILFNNAPWFRKMLREKWNEIGKDNLLAVLNSADNEVKSASLDLGGGDGKYITDFVRNRIEYIEKNLWK